jgi:hypothetical protein
MDSLIEGPGKRNQRRSWRSIALVLNLVILHSQQDVVERAVGIA